MGLNFQTNVYESPGMWNPDLWAQGPLSAAIDPCVDSYSCCIVPVLPTCRWRWEALMGPKMHDPLDNPPNSPESEARLQLTVFGGAKPLTKQVKTL